MRQKLRPGARPHRCRPWTYATGLGALDVTASRAADGELGRRSPAPVEGIVERIGPIVPWHLTGSGLSVPAGALIGLIGPSGCGKSMLMRAIIGVQKVVSGTITVLGSPAGDPGLRRRVGYTTRAATIYDDLTVRQNLGYFRSIPGAPRSDID